MLDEREIEIFRLCVRINRLRFQIVRDYRMTPNFKGLGEALARFKHDLDLQSADAMGEMSSLGARASAAMGKVKAKVAETKAAVEEIEAFVADEGSNGGPTLSDSSVTSDQSQTDPVSQAVPEQLTVNGVSKV